MLGTPSRGLWLDAHVFTWASGGWTSSPQGVEASRAYDIHAHAERRLAEATTADDRVDVLSSLKRAIDHRVRRIDQLYRLRSVPIAGKPDDRFELLQLFGIARPRMVSRLIALRNAVEHQDVAPPNIDELADLAELAWYFLRSTDPIARHVIMSFELADDDDDGRYWVEVTVQPPTSWVPVLRGWVPPHYLSDAAKPSHAFVRVGEMSTAEARGRADLRPDDVYLTACAVRGPGEVLVDILRRYFEVRLD